MTLYLRGLHLVSESEAGTIAVGQRADLVLFEANPLAHLENARRLGGVMAAGRWLPLVTIKARRQRMP